MFGCTFVGGVICVVGISVLVCCVSAHMSVLFVSLCVCVASISCVLCTYVSYYVYVCVCMHSHM